MIRLFFSALILAALSALAGCASTQTLSTAQLVPVTTQLPPIRLMIDDGTGGDRRKYTYGAVMLDAMKTSGVFESINATATDARVELYLSVKQNAEPNIAHALVSAATLFVLPIEQDHTFTLDARVIGPEGVKTYSYSDRRKWTASLARPDSLQNAQLDSAERFAAVRNLITHFLNEIRTGSPLRPAAKKLPDA